MASIISVEAAIKRHEDIDPEVEHPGGHTRLGPHES